MNKINLAVFASGTGTNFQNLYHYFKDSEKISLKILISNNSRSGAINFAKENGITHYHISSITDENPDLRTLEVIKKENIDLVILAGYMKKVPEILIQEYKNRILNIHPALLPKYGGKGMWGDNVHKAVLENKDSKSGVTVHLVNEEYDKGKILIQKSVDIDNDDLESLKKKIHFVEYEIYPKAIETYVKGFFS